MVQATIKGHKTIQYPMAKHVTMLHICLWGEHDTSGVKEVREERTSI
jgi:hypothetical protein